MSIPKTIRDDWFLDFANGDYNPPEHHALGNILLSLKLNFIEEQMLDTSKVPEAREKLKKLLDGIISNQKLIDSEELRYFLEVPESSRPEYHIDDGRLIERWVDARRGMEFFQFPYWCHDRQ